MTQKFIDKDGLKVLWNQISLKDYPNNETLMAVIDAIDETKANKDEIVQADWNQTDENKLDYIKNRPFGTRIGKKYLIKPQTIIFDSENRGYGEHIDDCWKYISTGTPCEIEFDGETYACITEYDGADDCYVHRFTTLSGIDVKIWDLWHFVAPGLSGEHTVSLSVDEEIIDLIDEKFIPDTIARVSDMDERFEEITENTIAKLDEAKAYTDTQITDFSDSIDQLVFGLYEDGKDLPIDGTAPSIREIANDEATTLIDEASNELSEEIKNKQFYINLTSMDEETMTCTFDKTFEEIDNAYNDGKLLYILAPEGTEGNSIIPLITAIPSEGYMFVITMGLSSVAITITPDSSTFDILFLATQDSIPTKTSQLENDSNFLSKRINWLQNNNEEYDYVLNRTHYSDWETNTIIFQTKPTTGFTDGMYKIDSKIGLIAGSIYAVRDNNGRYYPMVAEEFIDDDGSNLGVGIHIPEIMEIYDFSDEMANVMGSPAMIGLKDSSISGRYTVEIWNTIETVHKLDKKYLPKELDAAMDAFISGSKSKPVEILKIDSSYNYEKIMAPNGSMCFLHVSDSTFTIDELVNGVTITYEAQGHIMECHFEQSELLDASGCIMGQDTETEMLFIMTLEDNYNLEGVLNFEKAGIYLVGVPTEDNTIIYPSSIQVHGHTINGLGAVVKDDYLPSDVVIAGEIAESCFENVGTEVDITWDGDITGKDNFMAQYYHVSDIVPTKSDLLKGGKIVLTSTSDETFVETEMTPDRIENDNFFSDVITITANRCGDYTNPETTAVIIIPHDNFGIKNQDGETTFYVSKKGIYLYKTSSQYVSLLDINDFKLPFYKLKPEHIDMSGFDLDVDLSNYATTEQLENLQNVVNDKVNILDIDSELSDSSINPVQNKIVTNELKKKPGVISTEGKTYGVTMPGNNIAQYVAKNNAESFNSATAIGSYSHAEGSFSYSIGDYSHSEGCNSYALGSYSHSEGYESMAEGAYAHAENNSTATGYYSHSEGRDTIASKMCQHVQGKFNIEDTYNTADGKYAHIVGNGESEDARSNAHTLDWDGNAWYQGSVEATAIILKSPNGTRFSITIGNDGVLSASEITE